LTADITVDAAAELSLTPGQRVWFSVKAQEVALYRTRPAPGSSDPLPEGPAG
jgi:molybdate transport system ATP-binding protein